MTKTETKALAIPALLCLVLLAFAFSGIPALEYAAAAGFVICLLVLVGLGIERRETGDNEDYFDEI